MGFRRAISTFMWYNGSMKLEAPELRESIADAVLLHTVDTTTEFPAAISSLEPDVAEPEVRAVQQLPAPSTSGSSNGDSQQTVQVVEPVRASAPLKQDWGV